MQIKLKHENVFDDFEYLGVDDDGKADFYYITPYKQNGEWQSSRYNLPAHHFIKITEDMYGKLYEINGMELEEVDV